MEEDYFIEKMDFSKSSDMEKLVNLQNKVYEGDHIFTDEGFKYWYLDNPNGKVISFNAISGDELAAHYALIPVKMEIESRISMGLLSMATVTHPDHRGKGLFKKLAQTSYDYASKNGFEFVVGVANANSYPGFIKHLGFQDVGMLDVLIGCSKNIHEIPGKIFKLYWEKTSIKWRLEREHRYSKDGTVVYGTYPVWIFNKTPFLNTFMGKVPDELIHDVGIPKANKFMRPFNLYVGMGSNAKEVGYKNVPKFIKHSPFHLIFLDLTGGKLPKMTKDNVFFQLMDFDVV